MPTMPEVKERFVGTVWKNLGCPHEGNPGCPNEKHRGALRHTQQAPATGKEPVCFAIDPETAS